MRVAVIGAGPAGLIAARELAKNNVKVVVFEKHEEVGRPVRCGEALFDLYHILRGPPSNFRSKINQVLVKVEGLHSIRVGSTPVWMLDKDLWLASLAAEVESLGADVAVGSAAAIQPLRHSYDYVLDCSGFPSQSSREYGISPPQTALAIQYTIRADVRKLWGRLYLRFLPQTVGYAWIFPKSPGEANVGIGWAKDPPTRKWRTLESFLSEELDDYTVVARTAGCIPVGVVEPLKADNVFICGDAAALANPYHFGGIHIALLSGWIAARSIMDSRPDAYRSRLLATIEGEMKVARFARSVIEESPYYHDKVVSYLSKKYSIDQIFSLEVYKRMLPFIHMWKATRLLDRTILRQH